MPPIDIHIAISLQRTGKDFREVHEWIDATEDKLAHHDLSRIAEFSRQLVARFGETAADEYVRHLQEDIRHRLGAIARDAHVPGQVEAKVADALAFFGCKP